MEEPGVHGVTKSQTQLSEFTSLHFKVGPVVCVSFLKGEICAEFFFLLLLLFVCFSFGGQG